MTEIVRRYGDREQFFAHFQIDKPFRREHYPAMIADDRYPTLTDINIAYGDSTATNLLAAWIVNLETYLGSSVGRLELNQRIRLADDIVRRFCFLKVTELMVFFAEYRTGAYGHPYGSLDPITLCEALRKFISERGLFIDRYNQQERERKQREDQAANPPVTWEKYCERHGIQQPNPIDSLALGRSNVSQR